MKAPSPSKPLPAGRHRLVRLCTCGRRIPERDRIALDEAPPCPDCGGRQRRWWRRPVTLWERLRAWWELDRWKQRNKHPCATKSR